MERRTPECADTFHRGNDVGKARRVERAELITVVRRNRKGHRRRAARGKVRPENLSWYVDIGRKTLWIENEESLLGPITGVREFAVGRAQDLVLLVVERDEDVEPVGGDVAVAGRDRRLVLIA